jgi:DNA-binding transcriptional LysR family regulator
MPMDPRRLLTFREVARQGSFSRAAEALSLTQSAVSQQVAALERQLGTRLLDRRPNGLMLTSPGEQLLEHAGAIADRLTLADAQIAEEVAAERRELRVGAFPSALATIVPDAVSALLGRVPDLHVSVIEGRTDALARGVRDGSLHLAVAFQDAHAARREHPGTRRHDLFTEPMVAALPPQHRLRSRDPIALRDLADDPWTVPSRDGLIARACARAGFSPRIAYLSSDPLSIRAIIAAGLAVSLTPRLLAPHLHGVHITTVHDQPAQRDVYALLPDTGARTIDEQLIAALADAQRLGTRAQARGGPRTRRRS